MNMSTKTRFLSNLLATTIFCGAVSVATPAFAQDEDQNEPPQTGPVEASQDAGEENIIVTGSRIPQPNLTATSPVTVVNSQEVRLTGTTRAEDLINSLPQAFATQGANIANGSTGTATLNLRGLGARRTLVLVNGRRLLPGDPSDSAADINAIPAFMIDRVDVLTGGASSVYGADAVAGVVNFIMDTNFEGVRLDTQYSLYQHNNSSSDQVLQELDRLNFGYPTGNVADGGSWDIGIAFGVGFDDGRGHITAYAGYRHTDPVLQGKRDYSACALTARTAAQVTATPSRLYQCGGSATSNPATIIAFEPTGDPARPFTSTLFQIGPNRTLLPGFTPFNFGPLNHYQRPDERYTAGLFANYEISPALQPYVEFMFMDDRTVAQIAPSGNFGNTFSINCNNPLLSAQQRAIICAPGNLVAPTVVRNPDGTFSLASPPGNAAAPVATVGANTNDFGGNPAVPAGAFAPATFIDPVTGLPYQRGFAQILRRNTEGGPRQDDLQHTEYRVVAGMRGDLDAVWSYDTYYQYGRTIFAQTYLNDFSISRIARAIDVIDNPNTAAVDPTCRSVLTGDDPNCVPWDIFNRSAAPSAASNAYLSTPGFTRGIVEQIVANASVTGNLGEYGLQFPWASSGVGVALGVEYRKEMLDFRSDIAFQTGDLSGQGAATLPVSGEYDVREVFAEARIPIIEESFIHELTLEVGYRYSDYGVADRSFSTDTYKVAGFFAPIRDVRFRGGYNRAVRAPNIQELFAPQRVALDGNTDPCAGFTITAADTGCIAQGLRPGQFIAPNPAEQYNGLIGGDANLTPEVADTLTAGVVIQPRWIPRFALTIDWFDIDIKNAINIIGADTIVGICTSTADPFFCSQVNRDQFGSLWRTSGGFVRDLTRNIGGFKTRGVDIGASYSMDIGSLGNFGFNFQGTWLDRLVTDTGITSPGVDRTFDCVGLYGTVCLTPTPEWRHTARISYTHPDGVGLTFRWRHFGSVDLDATRGTGSTALGGLGADGNSNFPGANNLRPADLHLRSMNYFDLAANFRVGDHFNFRMGVNNILDKDPPLVGQTNCPGVFCNGNSFANVYDSLGRYIFAGVTLDF
jgi:outer membrane receptor protein involved in Fe transport